MTAWTEVPSVFQCPGTAETWCGWTVRGKRGRTGAADACRKRGHCGEKWCPAAIKTGIFREIPGPSTPSPTKQPKAKVWHPWNANDDWQAGGPTNAAPRPSAKTTVVDDDDDGSKAGAQPAEPDGITKEQLAALRQKKKELAEQIAWAKKAPKGCSIAGGLAKLEDDLVMTNNAISMAQPTAKRVKQLKWNKGQAAKRHDAAVKECATKEANLTTAVAEAQAARTALGAAEDELDNVSNLLEQAELELVDIDVGKIEDSTVSLLQMIADIEAQAEDDVLGCTLHAGMRQVLNRVQGAIASGQSRMDTSTAEVTATRAPGTPQQSVGTSSAKAGTSVTPLAGAAINVPAETFEEAANRATAAAEAAAAAALATAEAEQRQAAAVSIGEVSDSDADSTAKDTTVRPCFPNALPDGWQSFWSPENGRYYFLDTATDGATSTWDVPTAPSAGFCAGGTSAGAPLVTACGLDAISQQKIDDRQAAFKKACSSTEAKAARAADIKLFSSKERKAQLEAKRAQGTAEMGASTVLPTAENPGTGATLTAADGPPASFSIHSDDGQMDGDDIMITAQAMVDEAAGKQPVFRAGTQAADPSAACPVADTDVVIV